MKPSEWIEAEAIRTLRVEEDPMMVTLAHARLSAVIAYLDSQYELALRDTTLLPPPPGAPEFCEHANECPNICPCTEDCYCRTHTCAPGPRGPASTLPPAGANGPVAP